MKKELLVPVGNLETLPLAIHNGCDAVYLGGKQFGARAYADNFSEEELTRAIRYSHLYGVKIYVTVNTLIDESDFSTCMDYIRFLHQNNVDAVIMQDIGLIKKVRQQFPNLAIHASTQMNTHNEMQLKLLEELGAKRVVLARELSLMQINNFNTTLEIEVFIHGALCISYSGQCLFSSMLLDRSGNKGACAGICRLPFSLYQNDKPIKTKGEYLLSPKELATYSEFDSLMKSNILSFKIEGRMKSPYYVAYTTRFYRMLIDSYEKNQPLEIKEEDIKKLKVLYNREFTKGHLFLDKNEDLMNSESPNHKGIYLGKVVECSKKKIKIYLEEDLHQEDGIRFKTSNKGLIVNFLYNEKGLLIHNAAKGEFVYVDNKIGLQGCDTVYKTIDHELEKTLSKIEYKKIPVTVTIIAHFNKPLSFSICDGKNTIELFGSMVEYAKTSPITMEKIKEKITLGDTPFILQNSVIDIDEHIFINIGDIKKLKREATKRLQELREGEIPNPFLEQKDKTVEKGTHKIEDTVYLSVLVRNETQLQACIEEDVHTIYTEDETLYQKYKDRCNLYLRNPRIKSEFKEYRHEKLLIGELGALYKYAKENEIIGDYSLNIVNCNAIDFVRQYQTKRITLSIENKEENIKHIVNKRSGDNLEVFIYGKPEVMVMHYCPLNRFISKNNPCKVCQNGNKYYLKDRNGKFYQMRNTKENHESRLYYYKNIDLIEKVKNYKTMGINHFRIDLLEETYDETKSIICKVNCVNNK